MAHKFKLGSKIRDMVSGLTGITTSRIEYLNGCIQYSIRMPLKETAVNLPESYWFDEAQLEFIDNGIVVEQKSNGGPESIAHDYNG